MLNNNGLDGFSLIKSRPEGRSYNTYLYPRIFAFSFASNPALPKRT